MNASIDELSSELLDLLDRVRAAAPAFPLELVDELVRVGEAQVALEILCDNLHELGVELATETRRELVRLCVQCRADQRYWSKFA